ncbi:MAG: hypothetical protein KZQ73_00195, partial [Candidatus Thiodiazotropha sp. (ex Semelilucina semeliformis)]|nr:hypothetical protein [Candidatus Thiodiazotropha sp. (ex Semelilucina semeliformis)]
GRDQQFGYDQLDRLTNANGAYGDLGYSYDATGNRLSLTNGTETDTYTYAPGSHQLQQILSNSTDSRSYDAAGNTIQSLIGSYSYDDSNRLTGFSKSGVTAEYAYNGKGERIKKTVNGITTRFRYADSGQLLGEYDGTGQAIREYVYLGETPVAMLQSTTPTSQTLLQAVSTSHLSQQVSLGNHISQPVVIAGPPTNNGTQGAIVALSNITNTSANVSVQEWNYLDGAHLVEDISLLALPVGRYPQADGSTWEIGRFNLSGTKQWHDISFSEAFQTTPYLILTQQTRNDLETSVVRARNLSQTGFQASLSEQESLQNGHPEETIGYLAIHSPNTSGTARFYGADLNYQLSQISLNQNWAVAGEQQLKYQEEQSKDSETGHVLETVDILQLEGHLFAQDVSTAGGDPAAIRRQGTTPTVTIEGNIAGDTITYLHTDHLGTVVKATDSTQMLVWDAERKPFGERNVTMAQVEMPLGFPGQYFDVETGNYYNYFRDYDPTTGRYLQSDPIGLGGGLNTYTYVGGNPLGSIDPYGLSTIVAPGLGSLIRPMPGQIIRPMPASPVDPVLPIPDIYDPADVLPDDPGGNGGDPCKGLRDQLRAHERKLREYRKNPYTNDNKGFLKNSPSSRHPQIIDGRIRNLEGQIENFKRQLLECEKQNGIC